MKLGKITFPKTAMLAPMAGVTDRAYRILCRSYGAAATVSEMVSIKGLCYGDKKSAILCECLPQERPFGIQLFGADAEFAARATAMVQQFQPDWIDWNMGCPVHKVVSQGAGSALMRTPDLAAEIVAASVRESSVPVTIKMRIGWDDKSVNAVDFAKAMEQAGASAVAVHGRTKEQLYSGKADWNRIAMVKEALHIPVIGNGDVTTPEECARLYEETNCDLVMIGRGSYGNPFLFQQIENYQKGLPYHVPTVSEKIQIMLQHIRMILDTQPDKPESVAIREARKHAQWYMTGLYGAAQFRARCYTLNSYSDAEKMAEDFLKLQEGREA